MMLDVSNDARQRAADAWSYEYHQTQIRQVTSVHLQMALFGLLISGTLIPCLLEIQAAHLPQLLESKVIAWSTWIAWTTLASVMTTAATSVGNLLVRSVSGNISKTIASAILSYCRCVAVGCLLACLTVPVAGAEHLSIGIALGVAVGLLGERLFGVLSKFVREFESVHSEDQVLRREFRRIEGPAIEDMRRLQAQGISTIHALAFASIPRMFFMSSIELSRLCDWQDQALLHVYLGENRATSLRQTFRIRGMLGFYDLTKQIPRELLPQFVETMGLTGEAQVDPFLKIVGNADITLLSVYHSSQVELPHSAPAVVSGIEAESGPESR
jgi:hypothetical protein